MRSNFKREICLCFIYTLSIQSEGHFTPLLFVCQDVVHTGKVRSAVDFSTCDISFVGSKGNLISHILVNHKSYHSSRVCEDGSPLGKKLFLPHRQKGMASRGAY